MDDLPEKSHQEQPPLDTRRWKEKDISSMGVRTAHDPQFFTQHMFGLRVLGLALSDPTRLLILGLLVEEDRSLYGQEIAERLGVTPQTISHHLQILKNGGLVREERRSNAYRYYTLDTARINEIRATYFADDHLGLLNKDEARQQVLENFFQDGRLTSIPAQRSKRLIILEELALRLTWGRIYSELEVNAILKPLFEDVASLRRYLIDEGIVSREQGRYWLAHPRAENLQNAEE